MNLPIKTYEITFPLMNEYIAKSDVNLRDILRKILRNTSHISYTDFKHYLEQSFNDFITYCTSNNIISVMLFMQEKNTSSFWVIQHFIQFIKVNNITSINFNIINDIAEIDKNQLIVLFEDCLYNMQQLYLIYVLYL